MIFLLLSAAFTTSKANRSKAGAIGREIEGVGYFFPRVLLSVLWTGSETGKEAILDVDRKEKRTTKKQNPFKHSVYTSCNAGAFSCQAWFFTLTHPPKILRPRTYSFQERSDSTHY